MKKFFLNLVPAIVMSVPIMAQLPVKTINKTIDPGRQKTILNPVTTVFQPASVKICLDRPTIQGNYTSRNFNAVKPPPKINSDGSVSNVGVIRQPLAAETNKMWDPGQTVTVFLSTANSTNLVRQKVMFYARQWESIANIKFDFNGTAGSANIKVEFSTDNRSWSWIGKEVLFNPLGLYTMHYGWFTDQTAESEFQRVVEHEFGHALGFIHEHQSPASGIQWDKEKVYAVFGGPPDNWSRAEIDQNIFAKYSRTNTNFSAYDPYSIMQYAFPPELTTNGFSTPVNTNFSGTDRQYARLIYPFPVTPSAATGTLRTGDDCDLIDFKVEYNVVPADKVEFVLELGQYNNKPRVTWWKQIAIPLKNNRESLISAQDNTRTATVRVNAADLDLSKAVGFWKAKFLGVHTLLGYKWNVLSALKGGCRVRLTWKNDTCN